MSQPGLGPILGARVLAEFDDDHDRYVFAEFRKNYAGTSPITRAFGKKKVVAARFVHNDRLIDALMPQAAAALRASPGARGHYARQRDTSPGRARLRRPHNWRILTKLRSDLRHATRLLRALLMLTNLEITR